ncbi:MAG: hypothetical protein ACKOEX_05945 [Planctomycetia bacterium]
MLLLMLGMAPAGPLAAADLGLTLPLQRSVYQTNERIDFTVHRPAGPGTLEVTLQAADGGRMAFTMPASRGTEHLHVNAALLRPAAYTVTVAEGAATAAIEIEVVSHVRRSNYRLINWSSAQKPEEFPQQGESGFGYNMLYGQFGRKAADIALMRAGVDAVSVCTMSGGHQMDLRMECDWSDPYVTRGGTQRVAHQALIDRSRGNVPGVHFYDEPGLTWWKNPETGVMGPHDVPQQVRAFEAAFGRSPPQSWKLDPNKPADVAAWQEWATWKLGFMDAAWKEAQFGVSYVRPDFLSLNQSQYGWSAFTDGYYFNVVRSLPVISGHGGYDDFGLGYFNPSYYLEMARARDLARDCWYLPTWLPNTTDDDYRLEQNLSFQTGIEGMMSPPPLEPARNASALKAIVECNRLMGRLGTIFTTMPVTRPPVAMLYSLSDVIAAQTADRSVNYAHAMPQGQRLPFTYLAGKLIQRQFLPIVDEDVVDGTLAAHHRAVILTAIRHLDPAVTAALEDFAAHGGLVLLTGDCTVAIKGGVNLGVKPRLPDEESEEYKALVAAKKWPDLTPFQTVAKHVQAAEPLAEAIAAKLDQAGIPPLFECDAPGIVATRQAEGDVEYLFAVNATADPAAATRNASMPAAATIALPAQGKTVYDALQGGAAKAKDRYEFGKGEMRVFALTARPIGAVSVAAPVVHRDLTQQTPITLRVAATVVDDKGGLLAGSVPLRIRVLDPQGNARYDLHRATKLGVLSLDLPLAANDRAGDWSVVVTELLDNKEGKASFAHGSLPTCGAAAGLTRRAIMLGGEETNFFRFARVNHAVTIVKGSADHHGPAAERLKKDLAPWGVTCTIVDAAGVSGPRSLTEEEAKTWVGLTYTGSGATKPGAGYPLTVAGFAVAGPVILLGAPEDNPLIKFLAEQNVLPYAPKAGAFPGAGRGYVAWQRDMIGKGQESVALMADDAEGMGEAVGAFYEAVAGLEPLTPWVLPAKSSVAAP